MKSFKDGIISLTQKLTNQRNAHSTNRITSQRVDWEELRSIYKSGLGSKIIRLKSGMSLDDTLQFSSEADKDYYEAHLQAHVKKAVKFMLAFGRGIIVPHEPNADLSKPIGSIADWSKVRYHVFSGDMVYVGRVNLDLASPNYFQPEMFHVRAAAINPQRVIDFRYVEPVEHDAPTYNFGGISEFELIRNEIVSDQIVQRAVPGILERASTLFYKIEGFKELLADRKENDVLTYLGALENLRSVYGAGVLDSTDGVQVHNQQLSNLADSDVITLRRLSMVTGLPLSWLVGEAARGLNSTGEGERQVLQQTMETLQSEYELEPINRFMRMHGCGPVSFKENQGEDPITRIEYESKAIKNATLLYQLGEDYRTYLKEKNIVTPDSWDTMFPQDKDEPDPELEPDMDFESLMGDSSIFIDFDESKVKRDGGKFATKEGSGEGDKKEKKYTEDDYSYDKEDYDGKTNAVYEASSLSTVNDVEDEEKFNKIKQDMKKNGYHGEPILMVDTGAADQAITGSHRILAAQSINEDFPIPVYKLNEDILNFESDDGDTITDIIGRGDEKVLEFLEEYGDKDAIKIIKSELDNNENQ